MGLLYSKRMSIQEIDSMASMSNEDLKAKIDSMSLNDYIYFVKTISADELKKVNNAKENKIPGANFDELVKANSEKAKKIVEATPSDKLTALVNSGTWISANFLTELVKKDIVKLGEIIYFNRKAYYVRIRNFFSKM